MRTHTVRADIVGADVIVILAGVGVREMRTFAGITHIISANVIVILAGVGVREMRTFACITDVVGADIVVVTDRTHWPAHRVRAQSIDHALCRIVAGFGVIGRAAQSISAKVIGAVIAIVAQGLTLTVAHEPAHIVHRAGVTIVTAVTGRAQRAPKADVIASPLFLNGTAAVRVQAPHV